MHFRQLAISAAVVAAWTLAPSSAALGYQFPAGIVGATDYRQCDALDQQWSAVMAEIHRDHEACLKTRGQDETGGATCSVAHCQGLHDLLLATGPKNRNAQSDSCRSSVNQHVQWEREYEARLAADRQAAARRNAEDRQWEQQQSQRQQAQLQQQRQALETYRQAQQARSAANTANSAAQNPAATIAGAVLGFLSNAMQNSARSSPPVDTDDKRDYNSEHDLVTDIGKDGISNRVGREVFTGASNQLKNHNLDMIDRMDQINRDLNSFASSSGGRSNTTTFTPQTLNAAIDAEMSTSAPAVGQQIRVNEAIDAELARNSPTVSQQIRLNEAIDEELNRTAPSVAQQQRLNAAIDEEMRRNGSQQVLAYADSLLEKAKSDPRVQEKLRKEELNYTVMKNIGDSLTLEPKDKGASALSDAGEGVLDYFGMNPKAEVTREAEQRADDRRAVEIYLKLQESAKQGTTSLAAPNSSNSSASGYDMIMLADGSRFQGGLVNGNPNGNGVLVDSKGLRYEGYFENGKIKSGVVIYPDGSRYKVVNGKVAGKS